MPVTQVGNVALVQIRFPGGTSRLEFNATSKPKSSSIDVVYTIQHPRIRFANGSDTEQLRGVAVGTGMTPVPKAVTFVAKGDPPLNFQVNATVREVGTGKGFTVVWVVQVVLTAPAKAAAMSDTASAGLAALAMPLDAAESGGFAEDLEYARATRRVLRILLAGVERLLDPDGEPPEAADPGEDTRGARTEGAEAAGHATGHTDGGDGPGRKRARKPTRKVKG